MSRPTADFAETRRQRLGHVRSLDGVRGVAVLLVVGYHAFNWPRNGGTIGVGMFFVLSGFLITSILLDEYDRHGTINFRAFYARRVLRLFPLLYLSLGVVALSIPFFRSPDDRQHLLTSLAYCAFYIGDFYGIVGRFNALSGVVGHFWSLAVEEQFYFVWPAVLLLLRRRHSDAPRLLRAVGWGIATAIVGRAVLLAAGKTIWTLPSTHADALLTGCGLAIVTHAGISLHQAALRRVSWIVSFALVGALFLPLVPVKAALGGWYVAIELLGLGVLVCALAPSLFLKTLLELRPLAYCGRISYGLYILHPIVAFAIERNLSSRMPYILRAILAVALALGLSAASRRWFESYFLGMKERFRPTDPLTDPVVTPAVDEAGIALGAIEPGAINLDRE